MNTVLALGDRLRDTCESHARCNVIEVMGRHAGYIAIETGLALNAIGVAVNEKPFDKEEIMQRFKRGDESRSEEGHGLGLAIAKAIITSHKGKIEVLCYDGFVEFKVQIPTL